MGPEEGRSGPAKIKNKRRQDMFEEIENALSEAMTAPDTRSLRKKLEDKASNFGRKYQDKMSEFRLTGEIQKYAPGGRVEECGGDVRYNRKRGKTY